jgi:hypothetical protein
LGASTITVEGVMVDSVGEVRYCITQPKNAPNVACYIVFKNSVVARMKDKNAVMTVCYVVSRYIGVAE